MTLAPIRGFGSTDWIGFEDLEHQYQTLSTRLQRCARNPHDNPRKLLMQCDALLKNMALRATCNLDKREQLELYRLQLETFQQHFSKCQEKQGEKKTMTTFHFQNAPREVAEEISNGGVVQPEGSRSARDVFDGTVAKLSDQLLNPLKQMADSGTFATVPLPGEDADIDASGISQQPGNCFPATSNGTKQHSIPQKETEKVLVVETVEDLDIWD